MGWKETIERLPKRFELLADLVKILISQSSVQDERLKKIEAQLQAIHQDKSRSEEKMADRLIEMSMVQRGESREANVHRRTTPDTASDEPSNLWGELPDEAQWPPKGVDVVAQV